MTLHAGPTSQTFISQRLRLNYVDWGNRDAPPLVLVHGGRDHARSWDWVAEDLCRDWHVTAFDHRGHGAQRCREIPAQSVMIPRVKVR